MARELSPLRSSPQLIELRRAIIDREVTLNMIEAGADVYLAADKAEVGTMVADIFAAMRARQLAMSSPTVEAA